MFDNIVDKKQQTIIKNTLLDINFPWFFAEDVTYTNNKKQSRPAFKHYFVIDRMNQELIYQEQFFSITFES